MGAHRPGAQYTASCVYDNTDVNVEMGINTQNDFCVVCLGFSCDLPYQAVVASPNHAEGQDTQDAEQCSY